MQETIFNKKVIVSGRRVEVYKYQGYIRQNKESTNDKGRKGKGGQGAKSEESKIINRKATLNKARNKIIRLCNSNEDLTTFITLTYKENFQDLSKSKIHLNYFLKKVQKDYPNFKYLYVLEFQERGAIHYHMLCNLDFGIKTVKGNRKKIKAQKDIENWFAAEYWSNRGFVDIRNLESEGNTNAGKYVATYLVEDLYDIDLKGAKCYGYSRNLNKPVEIKSCSKDNVEDIVNEYKDYKLNYTSMYFIDYINKDGNERTSKVNYYDFYKE